MSESVTSQNPEGEYLQDQVGGFSVGDIFSWLGRLMIAALFIIGGVLTAMNFRGFSQTIQQLRLPMPTVLAVIAILTKIVGGLLFTGLIPIPMGLTIGRLSLIVFTAIVTFLMHNPLKDSSQTQNFLKNIAIIGGLLAA